MKLPILPLALRCLVATGAAYAILATAIFAQAPAPGAPTTAPGAAPTAPVPPAKPLSPMEKNFVKNAAKTLVFFSALAEASKTKTDFADPKEPLGRLRGTLEKDSKKAFEALNVIAKAHNEPLPAEATGTDKTNLDRMARMKDDKFAREWMDEILKEAKKLDRDYDQMSKTAQDPDLKAYVSNYGAMIRNMFTSAEATEKGLKTKK